MHGYTYIKPVRKSADRKTTKSSALLLLLDVEFASTFLKTLF